MKKEYVENITKEELEVMYENLTIKDDFIFGKVMENKENCVEMLERLTGNRISGNISINNQKAIKVAVDGKGVRYDVYVEDDAGVMYDAEMQREKNKSILPKRSRFYQGLMDLGYLETGDEYVELADSYVIFICTFDPFDEGLCCYEFENHCDGHEGIGDIPLGDGRKILIYNTKGTVVNVSPEVYIFLCYIEDGKMRDEYTKRLNSSVAMARYNRKWRVEYMKTFVHDMDVRREGRIEGIELGKSFGKMSLVCKKLRKGKSVEAIAEELEEENSEISDMCEIAKKFAPDYDEEMVWKNYLSKYMLD
ncbi:MAG: Rpn family recombination-promoting nuclease/putative transposase [Lachnospiraceae bacterium]|nr:Rpn family recombination-promoting nuclease/putative transposase [Lachnospiraceae bacterium]